MDEQPGSPNHVTIINAKGSGFGDAAQGAAQKISNGAI